MAWNYLYVDLAQGGSSHGGSQGDPFSITDLNARRAGGAAAAGDWYYVKGNGSLGASTTWTNDGSTASPIVFQGVDASWNSLLAQGRTSNNKTLDRTNFPVLTTGGYSILAHGSNNLVFMNMSFSGAYVSGYPLRIGQNSVAYRCYAVNSGTGAAKAFYGGGPNATFLDCDAELTGASGSSGAYYSDSGNILFYGCRVLGSPNHGFDLGGATSTLVFCVVEPVGGKSVIYSGAAASISLPILIHCTLHNPTSDCIAISAYAHTGILRVLNTLITGGATGINNLYSGTAALAGLFANLGLKNDGSDFVGFSGAASNGWKEATNWNQVTPTNDTSEYVDAGGEDFNLVSGAVSKGAGTLKFADIGALQRQEAGGDSTGIPFIRQVMGQTKPIM